MEDGVSIDDVVIEALFVGGTFKVKGGAYQDIVDHCGPKTWRFWMALKSVSYREHVANLDGRAL